MAFPYAWPPSKNYNWTAVAATAAAAAAAVAVAAAQGRWEVAWKKSDVCIVFTILDVFQTFFIVFWMF